MATAFFPSLAGDRRFGRRATGFILVVAVHVLLALLLLLLTPAVPPVPSVPKTFTLSPIRAPDLAGPMVTWGGEPLNPKLGKNRLHLDIAPLAGGDQQAEVDRLVSLGARRIAIGQGDVDWAVMADCDDNEFCVLTPRSSANPRRHLPPAVDTSTEF